MPSTHLCISKENQHAANNFCVTLEKVLRLPSNFETRTCFCPSWDCSPNYGSIYIKDSVFW